LGSEKNCFTEMGSSQYPVDLPEELQPYYVYVSDLGKCVLAIPMTALEEAEESGDLDMYEVAVPYRYLLSRNYAFYQNHVIADVQYERSIGLIVPDGYTCIFRTERAPFTAD